MCFVTLYTPNLVFLSCFRPTYEPPKLETQEESDVALEEETAGQNAAYLGGQSRNEILFSAVIVLTFH